MLHKAKEYLSSPGGSLLCFITSIAIKLGLIRVLLSLGNDLLLIMLTTRNWLEGHGIAINKSFISNLSNSTYLPYTGWPPGIHSLLAPFLLVTGTKYFTALFLFLSAITVFFFWSLRKLLLHIGFPAWQTNLFLVFQSLTLGKFVLASSPTDYLGLACLVCGCHFLFKLLNGRREIISRVAAIFSLSLAGLTRYQYVPVVLFLLIAVVVAGMLTDNKVWIRVGAALTGWCSLVMIGIITFFLIHAQGEHYISPIVKGFYPGNMVSGYPFILASFIDLDLYSIQLGRLLKTSYEHMIMIFSVIGYFLLFLFFSYSLNYVISRKFGIDASWQKFLFVAGTLSLANILLLFLLSLLLGTQLNPLFGNWTFIMEARYFAFPVLFLQILIWRKFLVNRIAGKLAWAGKQLLIILILIWVMHGCYFLVKEFSKPMAPLESLPLKEKEIQFVYNYIRRHRQVQPETHLVFTGVNKRVCYAANWYGVSALYDALELNKSNPSALKKTILVAWVRDEDKKFLTGFLTRKDVRLIYSEDQFNFYLCEIPANRLIH